MFRQIAILCHPAIPRKLIWPLGPFSVPLGPLRWSPGRRQASRSHHHPEMEIPCTRVRAGV